MEVSRLMALLIAVLLGIEASAASPFRWPWDQHRHFRHHRRVSPDPALAPAPPVRNCDRINESVKVLTPKNLARALDESTKEQRKNIDNCARQGESAGEFGK
jgi:hypothetical protein